MSMPVFIDAVHAAELLRVSPDTLLDLIAEGRLRTYGGKAANPFLRSADVLALAPQLGVSELDEEPKRVKSPAARVRQRLTADARWSDVSEDDIREWARREDPASREAGRTAARTALERLSALLSVLEDAESGS